MPSGPGALYDPIENTVTRTSDFAICTGFLVQFQILEWLFLGLEISHHKAIAWPWHRVSNFVSIRVFDGFNVSQTVFYANFVTLSPDLF